MEHFDLIVVGAGPGGYVAAIKAAKLGLQTAIVESRDVGGTCLNRGCIPAKAMIHAASLYDEIKRADEFGIVCGDVKVDYEKVVAYKEDTVQKLVSGVEGLFKGNGVTLLRGRGVVHADKRVDVVTEDATTTYSADKIIIAAGSKPVELPLPGMDLDRVITSDALFALREQPESLVIIGGGVIGCEFANAYAYMGTKVTILEGMASIVPNMEKEISQNLKMILKKRGVDIINNAMVQSVSDDDGARVVHYVQKDEEKSVSGQYVLVSVGRAANTQGLFAPDEAPDMERGRITVDGDFQSSIPGIYAIGDAIRGMQLAHTASAQGIVCVEKMMNHAPSIALDVVPTCVYTNPEIASVGLSEDQAKAEGREVLCGKFIMSSNGKSLISHEERGFIKIVADKESHVILGAQMMCARATDMITELATAINQKLTAEAMLETIHPHPTYNEGIGEALEEIVGEAIHIMPKKKKK